MSVKKIVRPRWFYIAEPPFPRERIGGVRRTQLEAGLLLDPWQRYQTAKGRAKSAYRYSHPLAYSARRVAGRLLPSQKKAEKLAERVAVRAAKSAMRAASPFIDTALSAAKGAAGEVGKRLVAAGGTAATLGAAAAPYALAAGEVLAAALAGYIITTVGMQAGRASKDERQRVANNAYRSARAQLAEKLGLKSERDIPRELLLPLTNAWKQAVATSYATLEPTSRGRIY